MLISLENAGVRRTDKWLVRGVTMQIEQGEIVTMIGPNGSGKSTTAKIALGIIKADEGIAYQKENLTVGYVPQKLDVNWTLPLSVSRFLRLTNAASKEQMRQALLATETLHLANSQMSKLSGGEFQRIKLATSLGSSLVGSLYVLDEPTVGLHPHNTNKLIEILRSLKNIGNTVIVVEHDEDAIKLQAKEC